MSKKSKKTEAPEEEIVNDTIETAETEETAAEAAAENIEVSNEPENIQPTEEVQADEVNGAAEAVPADPDAKVGTVTKPVNFRTGPSFKNAVIAELKSGSKVTLNGTVEGDKGTWYKCEFDGREGYVKASGLIV